MARYSTRYAAFGGIFGFLFDPFLQGMANSFIAGEAAVVS
jgi:hypothetical protein